MTFEEKCYRMSKVAVKKNYRLKSSNQSSIFKTEKELKKCLTNSKEYVKLNKLSQRKETAKKQNKKMLDKLKRVC